jgi:hypothetical protein
MEVKRLSWHGMLVATATLWMMAQMGLMCRVSSSATAAAAAAAADGVPQMQPHVGLFMDRVEREMTSAAEWHLVIRHQGLLDKPSWPRVISHSLCVHQVSSHQRYELYPGVLLMI